MGCSLPPNITVNKTTSFAVIQCLKTCACLCTTEAAVSTRRSSDTLYLVRGVLRGGTVDDFFFCLLLLEALYCSSQKIGFINYMKDLFLFPLILL